MNEQQQTNEHTCILNYNAKAKVKQNKTYYVKQVRKQRPKKQKNTQASQHPFSQQNAIVWTSFGLPIPLYINTIQLNCMKWISSNWQKKAHKHTIVFQNEIPIAKIKKGQKETTSKMIMSICEKINKLKLKMENKLKWCNEYAKEEEKRTKSLVSRKKIQIDFTVECTEKSLKCTIEPSQIELRRFRVILN